MSLAFILTPAFVLVFIVLIEKESSLDEFESITIEINSSDDIKNEIINLDDETIEEKKEDNNDLAEEGLNQPSSASQASASTPSSE